MEDETHIIVIVLYLNIYCFTADMTTAEEWSLAVMTRHCFGVVNTEVVGHH